MERSGLLRWLLLGLAALLLINFVPKLFGDGDSGGSNGQPLTKELAKAPASRTPEKLCRLEGPRFQAVLSSQGAALKHFKLLPAKYRKGGKAIDLSTTPDLEGYRQLTFKWRNAALAGDNDPEWQTKFDRLDWQLAGTSTAQRCEFTYRSDQVELRKIISVTDRPYELRVEADVKNVADSKKRHALTVHTVAWRLNAETEGKMFRVSPYVTHVECALKGGETVRLQPGDFESDDFKEPAFARTSLNPGDWHQVPGRPEFAAVANAYFSHALVPLSSPKGPPACQLQIEDRWDYRKYGSKKDDPNAGGMYRARLAYEPVELDPGASARYEVLSYVGPKERDVLAAAGGGHTQLIELIDLGFFSVIAKVLVAFLLKVYQFVPSWGFAIIILTVTARVLLFPLMLPSMRSMIKMRQIRPEVEALNQKYKDDAQAKGLAQMELWRKHKINPVIGCLPQLASMPVWFALYTTLQTAVELYNIPFLWFPDLSEPDPFYILPLVIGGTYFLQQKIMPMQADPAQQKMMMYVMPGMFTVFMLFLPAGLGVYMFTNSIVGIAQQQIMELQARRASGGGTGKGTPSTETAESSQSASAKSRGKRAKRKPGTSAKLAEGRPTLGKGKA